MSTRQPFPVIQFGLVTLRQLVRIAVVTTLAWLVSAAPASAQVTRPAWYPPTSLYGRPVAQPYFDFPNWARYSNCRPAPLAWGYDPFPDYGPCEEAAACVPSVACPGDFVAHRPSSWYGSVDFAPLTMDRLDGYPLAVIGTNGPVALSTEDLQTEFTAGGKYTLGRRIFDCYRIEGSYLGYHSFTDERLVVNNRANALGGIGNLSTYLSGFRDPLTPGLDGANAVSAAVRSNFQSGELNVRYWGDMPPGPLDVSLLVGVRYIRLEDQFSFVSQATLPAPEELGWTCNRTRLTTCGVRRLAFNLTGWFRRGGGSILISRVACLAITSN